MRLIDAIVNEDFWAIGQFEKQHRFTSSKLTVCANHKTRVGFALAARSEPVAAATIRAGCVDC
jgi:hypothetical protein